MKPAELIVIWKEVIGVSADGGHGDGTVSKDLDLSAPRHLAATA